MLYQVLFSTAPGFTDARLAQMTAVIARGILSVAVAAAFILSIMARGDALFRPISAGFRGRSWSAFMSPGRSMYSQHGQGADSHLSALSGYCCACRRLVGASRSSQDGEKWSGTDGSMGGGYAVLSARLAVTYRLPFALGKSTRRESMRRISCRRDRVPFALKCLI